MSSSHWFLDQNNFLILFLHFAPRGTTRVGTLLLPSLIFCSKSLILNSDCEWFAQIAHDKRSTVRKSLRLLTKNERLWAIRSGHLLKMSDRKQITQVINDKRATWANRSFFLSKLLFAHKKQASHSKYLNKIIVFVSFILF